MADIGRQSGMAAGGASRNGIAGVLLAAMLFLAGCGASPQSEKARPDPTREAVYGDTVQRLAALDRQAEDLFKHGHHEEAAAAVMKGQPIEAKLLAAPHPTLAAMEAISDLDDLYARMLFSNHREVWARTLYEKNAMRWKLWKPQTADTMRRLRQAQDGIAACNPLIGR